MGWPSPGIWMAPRGMPSVIISLPLEVLTCDPNHWAWTGNWLHCLSLSWLLPRRPWHWLSHWTSTITTARLMLTVQTTWKAEFSSDGSNSPKTAGSCDTPSAGVVLCHPAGRKQVEKSCGDGGDHRHRRCRATFVRGPVCLLVSRRRCLETAGNRQSAPSCQRRSWKNQSL